MVSLTTKSSTQSDGIILGPAKLSQHTALHSLPTFNAQHGSRRRGCCCLQDDRLDIEVYMKESSMPQMVMAVATKKLMKSMLVEEGGEDGERS